MLKNKKAIAIISVLLIIFLLYNIFFTNNNILALSLERFGSYTNSNQVKKMGILFWKY